MVINPQPRLHKVTSAVFKSTQIRGAAAKGQLSLSFRFEYSKDEADSVLEKTIQDDIK